MIDSIGSDIAGELTLVTVTYNSANIIATHFESLLAQEKKNTPRWIVVDNCSSDNSEEIFSQFQGSIEVIRNQENIGFGAACNMGITQSTTRYVMVLNPDTRLSLGAVEKLLGELKRNCAAIAGPRLKSSGEGQGVREVESLVGAALLMDKHQMDAVGYFDEQFFLYREDRDLCRRALDAGLKIIQCFDVEIPHEGASSTSRTVDILYFVNYHKGRSFALYALKYGLPDSELERYVKLNRRRQWLAMLSVGRSRYLRAKGKLDGVNSVMQR